MTASQRTTLILNPVLVKRAKQLALDRGTTLGAIVNEALERTLEEKKRSRKRTFKVRAMRLGLTAVSPHDQWQLLEEEDLERVRT